MLHPRKQGILDGISDNQYKDTPTPIYSYTKDTEKYNQGYEIGQALRDIAEDRLVDRHG